ncbi:DNA polymerase [Mesorhizobium loti]|nr:DNA polymerase [Mesorhizobium loti]
MADKDDGTPKPAESQPDVSQANFQNPIVILATLILLSLFVMIGASMLGVDHGFLSGMARPELARGLITYLFAIVTIGIAVALVLNTLVGPAPSDANDGRLEGEGSLVPPAGRVWHDRRLLLRGGVFEGKSGGAV